MRKKETPALKNVRVAAPCHVGFENMNGDDRIRYCQLCKMNVYNIGGMSTQEATELIQTNEGRLCIRLYRRKDGTVITDNCPVGLRRIRDRLATITLLAVLFSTLGWLSGEQAHAQGLVGAPVDGPRGYGGGYGGELVECAKESSEGLLAGALIFLKIALTFSDIKQVSQQECYRIAYLIPFLFGAVVHFTYLGWTDEIVLTMLDGLARSLATGVTFGLVCLAGTHFRYKLQPIA